MQSEKSLSYTSTSNRTSRRSIGWFKFLEAGRCRSSSKTERSRSGLEEP